jgi:hypothetical protein
MSPLSCGFHYLNKIALGTIEMKLLNVYKENSISTKTVCTQVESFYNNNKMHAFFLKSKIKDISSLSKSRSYTLRLIAQIWGQLLYLYTR